MIFKKNEDDLSEEEAEKKAYRRKLEDSGITFHYKKDSKRIQIKEKEINRKLFPKMTRIQRMANLLLLIIIALIVFFLLNLYD